jgi:hypothetical protein
MLDLLPGDLASMLGSMFSKRQSLTRRQLLGSSVDSPWCASRSAFHFYFEMKLSTRRLYASEFVRVTALTVRSSPAGELVTAPTPRWSSPGRSLPMGILRR